MPARTDPAQRRARRQDYLALLGLAARHLGWSPAVFWQATPCELVAALRPHLAAGTAAAAPLTRRELAALARRFPDRTPEPQEPPHG